MDERQAALDREQMTKFEMNYGHMTKGVEGHVQSHGGTKDITVTCDAMRITDRKNRIARGLITVRGQKKQKQFRIGMQGERIWIKDTARSPHPSDAPTSSQGYNFENAENALDYIIGAIDVTFYPSAQSN